VTSSFFAAWLRGEPQATALLPDRFRRSEDRAEAVARAVTRPVDPALCAALVAFNARFTPSAARDRNLALLAQRGTAVVVTGQQVGLFLGPLFTVYKAATAIAAARQLSEETGAPVVPLFWLQTEDHDLPEIDHCFVPGPQKLKLDYPDASRSRAPVAHRVLGPSVTPALAGLREALLNLPNADEHLALLERAYHPEATMAGAFAEVVATLFAEEGLILLDPRDPAVAKLAAPIHRAAIVQAQPISEALSARGRALTDAGFGEQVHIRPGAPLSFYSPDGLTGPRYRLDPSTAPGTWSLVGHPDHATVTTPELFGYLETDPLRFTTSALLRPIVEDTLLPTAAYVGGPGEIAYFAQLSPLYALLDVPMPLTVLRSRFRILEERTRKLLEKVGMTADEVCASQETLHSQLATLAGLETPEALEGRLAGVLTAELARVKERLLTLDPTLSKPLERTEHTIRFAFSKLSAKYGRALARKDQIATERIERLRAMLVPDGAPQERVYGLPYFASRFGTRAFVKLVCESCVPFTGQQGDLTP
jgi:bacillithiol biosynthesis cysteine-adding enzyme BshC